MMAAKPCVHKKYDESLVLLRCALQMGIDVLCDVAVGRCFLQCAFVIYTHLLLKQTI